MHAPSSQNLSGRTYSGTPKQQVEERSRRAHKTTKQEVVVLCLRRPVMYPFACTALHDVSSGSGFRPSGTGPSRPSRPRLPDFLSLPDLGTRLPDIAHPTTLTSSKPRLTANPIKHTTIILLDTIFFHFSGFVWFISGTVWERPPTSTFLVFT